MNERCSRTRHCALLGDHSDDCKTIEQILEWAAATRSDTLSHEAGRCDSVSKSGRRCEGKPGHKYQHFNDGDGNYYGLTVWN